jgi:hypothetical protein
MGNSQIILYLIKIIARKNTKQTGNLSWVIRTRPDGFIGSGAHPEKPNIVLK